MGEVRRAEGGMVFSARMYRHWRYASSSDERIVRIRPAYV